MFLLANEQYDKLYENTSPPALLLFSRAQTQLSVTTLNYTDHNVIGAWDVQTYSYICNDIQTVSGLSINSAKITGIC